MNYRPQDQPPSVTLRARMLAHGTFSRLLELIAKPFRQVLRGRAPALASVAAVIEVDGRLLILERSDGLGVDLPGGLVRWGESAEKAVQREVHEETGLRVMPRHVVGIFSEPSRDPRFGSVCIAYACDVLDGTLRASEEGLPTWVSLEQLPEVLAFGNEAILAAYRDRSKR
jgi:8-oxo-dGTP diphosphatase